MNDSQERLREMLHRRGDRVQSSLTISDIRDAGVRSRRHPMRLLGPVLVAASVVILVVVVALAGRLGLTTVPPAGPGRTSSVTTPSNPTLPRTTVSSATGATTTSTVPVPVPGKAIPPVPITTTKATPTTTVPASR